jgi:3-oxoacyl-[acyl-carrier-protein] synthase-3
VVGLATAASLVDSGQYQRILFVVSCSYSTACPDSEGISLANGDGAAAFIVEKQPEGRGVLAQETISTWNTCGAIGVQVELDERGQPCFRMRADKSANALLRETSEHMVKACVGAALTKAALAIDDVSFFIFNTPTAWYASFCARALGVSADKTINTHALYANTGPVLMPTNLLHACHQGRIKPGDVVVMYAIGSVSNAAAAVVRWDGAALGPLPPADAAPADPAATTASTAG